MSQSPLVHYTVIGDRDDPDHPNAFLVHKALDTILVGDIADAFPLSGTFHFRFKIKYEAFGFVWLDLQDHNRKVPICEGKISMRVLPLSAVATAPRKAPAQKRAPANKTAAPSPQPQQPRQQQQQQQQPRQQPRQQQQQPQHQNSQEDLFGGSSSSNMGRRQTAPPAQQTHKRQDSMDALVDMMEDPMATMATSPGMQGGNDMFSQNNVRDRSGTNDLLDLVGDNEPASF